MHIILTGATGLIGSATLLALMGMQTVTKVSVLSRRPVPMLEGVHDERIQVVIQEDFNHYDQNTLNHLRGANGCIWALGVSQNAGNESEYTRITKALTLEAAGAFKEVGTANERFNFVFVSGEGATSSPGPFIPLFGRVKGDTEAAPMEIGKDNNHFKAIMVRPSFVDLLGHDELQPWIAPQSLTMRILGSCLGPVMRTVLKSHHSPTKSLGICLAELATGARDRDLSGQGVEIMAGGVTIANNGFRRLMDLH